MDIRESIKKTKNEIFIIDEVQRTELKVSRLRFEPPSLVVQANAPTIELLR